MADQDAHPTGKFWSIVGGLSGGFPGDAAGRQGEVAERARG